MPKMFTPISTRYASNDNLYQSRARTNTGKQTISSLASSLWQKLPLKLTSTVVARKATKGLCC